MKKRRSKPYLPTASEIQGACEAIQRRWSDKERRRRRYGASENVPELEIPCYNVRSLVPRHRDLEGT